MSSGEQPPIGGMETMQDTMDASKERLEAVVLGKLEVGYGTLGHEITEQEAQATLSEILTLNPESETGYKYLVAADPEEPATCGDGRPAKGLLSSAPSRPRNKIFGGDLQANWEADELVDGFQLRTVVQEDPEADPIERARGYLEKVMMRAHKRKAGGHISSDHQHGPKCGCGAIDSHTPSLEVVGKENDAVQERGRNELVELTAAAMTEEFDAELHENTISPNAARLAREEHETGYTGQKFMDMMTSPKPYDKVETETAEDGIEDLAGDHDELMLVVNYTDYTLDRDAFVNATGKQVFWIDEPAIKREANRYAKDETEGRERYQAMMTTQVAKGKALAVSGLQIAAIKEMADVPAAA